MKYIKDLGLSVLLSLSMQAGHTQYVIDANGGSAISANYSFSYSVGEISTVTLKSISKSNYGTSGVIQPDPFIIIKTEEEGFQSLYLFPNPSDSYFNIHTSYQGTLEYRILDLNSKELTKGKWMGKPLQIQNLEAGAYLIELKSNNPSSVKTIKFIVI